MNNEMVFVREMPTLKFIMSEMMQYKTKAALPENQKLGRLFYLLAAVQIVAIAGGAILGLFVAPASLFVSRTENDALLWFAAGLIGFLAVALGVILIPLSLIAANGFYKDRRWRKVVGIIAAGLALLQFPVGTICGGYLLHKLFRR
jgi:hypothetical protein